MHFGMYTLDCHADLYFANEKYGERKIPLSSSDLFRGSLQINWQENKWCYNEEIGKREFYVYAQSIKITLVYKVCVANKK